MSHERRRRPFPLLPAILAVMALLAGLTGPVEAAYQATVDVNKSAFNPPCDGDANAIVPKMQTAAVAAYKNLGYATTGYTGSAFTKAHVLSRTVSDWGYYVHSHGDYYWHAADGRRYTGFREDSGDCSQQVVFSKDIKAKRAGRQSNLVVVSTCHASDSNTTMPDAFAIEKTKTLWPNSQGPEFYVGYIGVQWDSDEWIFEQRFWNSLAGGSGVGKAFDVAMAGNFGHSTFDANWWGSYIWSGRAGPGSSCPNCD